MDSPERQEKLKEFFEEIGLTFEHMGVPRMAGKIFGWLLVSDPSEQSASQMVDILGASKGSISTALRILIQWGLVEKVGFAGERSKFYRMVQHPIDRMMQVKIMSMKVMREQMDRGLAIVADRPEPQKARLQNMRDGWLFFEQELPKLMEKFHRQRDGEG